MLLKRFVQLLLAFFTVYVGEYFAGGLLMFLVAVWYFIE